jgi:hypothetical protein
MKGQKNMQTINREMLASLVIKGNSAYLARTPEAQRNLNKAGIQKDCATALETVSNMSEAHFTQLNALALGPDAVAGLDRLAVASNVKTIKRAAQVLASLAGMGVPGGSGRTLFLAVGAVAVAGCKTRDGLQFAVTGKGNENTSDGINLTVARKLQRIGITSPASYATQYSVCFAPGAMGEVFGIGRKGKKGEMPEVNPQSPFARAILSRIASLTDIEIEKLSGDDKGEGEGKGKTKGKRK